MATKRKRGDEPSPINTATASVEQPAKKLKMTTSSDSGMGESEHEERVLREQKKHMLLKMNELKRHVTDLQKKLDDQKQHTLLSQNSLSIVTRYWNHLNDDLLLMLRKSASSTNTDLSSVTTTTTTTNGSGTTFLQQLLAEYDSYISEDEEDRIEKALKERCKRTTEILSLVIAAINTERMRTEDMQKKLKEESSFNKRDNIMTALRDANNQLRIRNDDLEKELAQMRIQFGANNKNMIITNDKVLLLSKDNEQLKIDLEDTKYQLDIAMRKIDKLKLLNDEHQQKLKNSADSMESQTPTSAKSLIMNNEDSQKLFSNMSTEIGEYKKQIEQRDKDIERLTNECIKLEQDKTTLERRQVTEEYVRQSQTFMDLSMHARQLESMWQNEQKRVDDLAKKIADMVRDRKILSDTMEKTFEQYRQELVMRLEAKEKELTEMRISVVDMETKFKMNNQTLEEGKVFRSKYEDLIKKFNEVNDSLRQKQKDFADLDNIKNKLKQSYKDLDKQKQKVKDLMQKLESNKTITQENRELAEIRASEQKHKDKCKRLEDELAKLKNSSDTIQKLRDELQEKKEEASMLSTELDKMAQSYDDVNSKCTKLEQDLRNKDDTISQTLRENIKLQQNITLLSKEKATVENVCKSIEEVKMKQDDVIKDLSTRIMTHDNILQRTREELMFEKRLDEKHVQLLHLREQHMNQLNADLERVNALLRDTAKKADDSSAALRRTETKNKSLSDQLDTLQNKFSKMQGSSATSELEDDVKFWKGLVTCSQCQTRRKDCVITRCFHTFCKECVNANLHARNRKCPTCKKTFGQGDVRELYL